MPRKTRLVTTRTPERLLRLAYDLEALASRLRAAGYDSHANGVQDLAKHSGNIGRDLREVLDQEGAK